MNHAYTAYLTGTGAAITVSCGFIPQYVMLRNTTDAGSLFGGLEWNSSMPAGYGLKTLGTSTASVLITSNGITTYAGVNGPTALTGTHSISVGGNTVTGSSSQYVNELIVGDFVNFGSGQDYEVVSIASATSMTVKEVCKTVVSGAAGLRMSGRAPGFIIGTDTDINVSTEKLMVLAIR
jgi:hypothetical protein